jgi:hypothetical protein
MVIREFCFRRDIMTAFSWAHVNRCERLKWAAFNGPLPRRHHKHSSSDSGNPLPRDFDSELQLLSLNVIKKVNFCAIPPVMDG